MGAERVEIPSQSRVLRGTLFGPDDGPGRDGALLFVHGLGSGQATYAERAAIVATTLKIQCLTFDLSGHGQDEANVSRSSVYDHLEDVIAAYDFLKANDLAPPGRIGACGASYGAYLTALLTDHRPVQRLLLRAPALARDVSFPDRRSPPERVEPGELADAFDSLAAVSRFAGPVLVLESECDERIPHSQIVAYLNACPQTTHEVIPGAKHALSDPAWDAQFVDALIRWFRSL